MRIALIINLILLVSLSAQQKLKPIGSDVHNFGTITKGQVVKHIFQLKNVSNKTITIEKVQSSCGCTAALISKRVLKPNEIAKITAEFNSEGFTGFQEKHIYVYEKDNPNPIYTLKIQANIFVELEVVPMYMVFDNAIVGVDKQSIVQIINRSDKKIKILKVENPYDNLQLKLDKYELVPGDYATIQGIFTPKVSGLIRGSFVLQTDSKQKKVEIKFYSNVKDRL
ncbi:MAG: DUF1573 domain-containing protein [Ignavibacteria bacterium]